MTLVRTLSWFADNCLIICLQGRKQEESQLSVSLFIKAQIPFIETPLLDLITSQKTQLLILSHWGFRFQHMNWGGSTNIQSIALGNISESV